ncbi:MAG TPA: hypothetical protein VIH09_09710 [Flavobacterium sp.]|uniref:hypothetical protein n=1 Tax=Flavobacterium sp. TaxID=239 RepID=UPI002F3E72BC
MGQFPMFAMMLFFTGIGNVGALGQYPIIFSENQRQAARVIRWTAAIEAFGPFIFASLIGNSITATGGATQFLVGLILFTILATGINRWFKGFENQARFRFKIKILLYTYKVFGPCRFLNEMT